MLAEEGTVIIKLFLNISKAEQKRRLESRLQDGQTLEVCMDDLDDPERWDESRRPIRISLKKRPLRMLPGTSFRQTGNGTGTSSSPA